MERTKRFLRELVLEAPDQPAVPLARTAGEGGAQPEGLGG